MQRIAKIKASTFSSNHEGEGSGQGNSVSENIYSAHDYGHSDNLHDAGIG